MNQEFKNLLALLFVFGGLGLSSLTIGAFAYQNSSLPFPLTLLRDFEGLTSNVLLGWTDLVKAPLSVLSTPQKSDMAFYAFQRGFLYMGFAIVFTSVAAMFVSETRRDSVPIPGYRKEA